MEWVTNQRASVPRHVYELMRRGQFAEARVVLEGITGTRSLLERARIAFFLDSDFEECDRLIGMALEQDTTPAERSLGHAIASCVAASVSGTCEQFDYATLAKAEPEELEEITYFIAFSRYLCRDTEGAKRWIQFSASRDAGKRARRMLLLGFVHAAEDRFDLQARICQEALALLESEAPMETYTIANVARSLALLVRDVPCTSGAERLEALYQTLPEDTSHTRFHIGRGLGWAKALGGDPQTAMQHFVRCATQTSDLMERAYVYLDYVNAAIFAKERFVKSTSAVFCLANEILSMFDWASVTSDDIAILPLAAQAAAQVGFTDIARRYCDLATQRQPHVASRYGLAHGNRLQSFLDESAAITYFDVDKKRSLRHAGPAHDAFASMGFSWRAGRMALLIYGVTRSTQWKSQAETHLAHYPNHPFQAQLNAVSTRKLTAQQQNVLDLVLRGLNTNEIAATLSLSPNTVRVHLGLVYRHHGVRDRYELLAKLASVS